MDEKKLLDLLKNSASDLNPPESLSPEAMEAKLLRMQAEKPKNTASDADEKGSDSDLADIASQKSHFQKNRKRFYFTRFAATAAVVVLCLFVVLQTEQLQKANQKLEAQKEFISTEIQTEYAAENLSDEMASSTSNTQQAATNDTTSSTQQAAANDTVSSTGSAQSSSLEGKVTDDNVTSGTSAEHAADTASEAPSYSAVQPASSYEEVYEALREQFYYEEDDFYPALGAKDAVVYEAGEIAAQDDIAVEDSANVTGSANMELADFGTADASADYSTTNIQEQGVDEADIVKTDGNYIYILRQNGTISIVKADPQHPETVSVISPADTFISSVRELYLDGDTLSIIADRVDSSLEQDGDTYYTSSTSQTALYTYDISDRSVPQLTGTVIQDGYYETSRKMGNYIYLFTSWYPELGATYEESDIIPKVNDSSLEASDFYLPEYPGSSAYLLISSVDVRCPEEILDKKALVSGVSNFYVSTENIYIANENYTESTTITELTKFSCKEGVITGLAAGSVKGYLNNSFSMNEYQGYLRVVSTCYDDNWEEQNALYILDDTLNLTGSIEHLAEGETIRSARFFGDTGYFVTFRQTDPLFSADLSDPANPKILGELKVSGFSSYLHFYGENLLLGMGYEANETTGEIYGVKLSMFDISDPTDVKELHRIVIPDVTWCPSLDNYRSILIDPAKNLFGFFCGDRYLVFSYEKENGFSSELVYDLMEDAIVQQTGSSTQESAGTELDGNSSTDADTGLETSETSEEDALIDDISASGSFWNSSMNCYSTRGLYIQDTFYLAGDSSVVAFDMTDDFQKIGTLTLERSEQ